MMRPWPAVGCCAMLKNVTNGYFVGFIWNSYIWLNWTHKLNWYDDGDGYDVDDEDDNNNSNK
jgi:hypothetical protein